MIKENFVNKKGDFYEKETIGFIPGIVYVDFDAAYHFVCYNRRFICAGRKNWFTHGDIFRRNR